MVALFFFVGNAKGLFDVLSVFCRFNYKSVCDSLAMVVIKRAMSTFYGKNKK